MDNLTHTLIGVLVGEAAAARSKPQEPELAQQDKRNSYVTLMAIGSNVPDLDFLYSTVTGSKLDYLLHHRGHTHTFIVGIVIAALLVLGCELWMRKRKLRPARADRAGLIAIALLAPVLHIFMDMTNNYGVHPWWPFDNRWTYGDSVFIVEPLLWAASAPLVFCLRTRLARGIAASILAVGVALVFLTGMVPIVLALGYTILLAALLAASRRLPAQHGLAVGFALWLAVTFGFMAVSHFAARRVDAVAATAFPKAQTLDRVLTPMPVNPFCWETLLIQHEDGAVVIRRGMLAMTPAVLPAARCPGRGLDIPVTAPLQPVAVANDERLHWHGEVRSPLAQLRELWAKDCRVGAFMRFARAPWLARIDEHWVIGDLRYDREPALGFAELVIDSGPEADGCPHAVPPWISPRAELSPDP